MPPVLLPPRVPGELLRKLRRPVPSSAPELRAAMEKNLPGDHYGLLFPHSFPQLVGEDYGGAAWLTRAFRAAGSLPRDLQVSRIVRASEFFGGGAAKKAVLTVEYAPADAAAAAAATSSSTSRQRGGPYPHAEEADGATTAKGLEELHTELFVKMPLDPSSKDRMITGFDCDPPEVMLNRFYGPSLPVRVPKYYFGDMNRDSTNFIIITERIPYGAAAAAAAAPAAESSSRAGPGGSSSCRRRHLLPPGEIEPAYDKYNDYELPQDGAEYYFALLRTQARICAAYKTGRLGDQVDEVFGTPKAMDGAAEAPPTEDELDRREMRLEMTTAMAGRAVDFVTATAPQMFHAEERAPGFLEKWRQGLGRVAAREHDIQRFLCAHRDYVAFGHPNLNIDNAFFWREDGTSAPEEGRKECGLIDFGGISVISLGNLLQWSLFPSEVEMLLAHEEGLLRCFVEEYARHGGPKVEPEILRLHLHLARLVFGLGTLGTVPVMFRYCRKQDWPTMRDRFDPRITGKGSEDDPEAVRKAFLLRCYLGGLVNFVALWRRQGLQATFEAWQAKLLGAAQGSSS